MDVQLVTMDPTEAREQLREYRASLHRSADAEYEAVAAGLEALAAGHPVISLERAIREGGFDEQMRPRLAIARADRRHVGVSWLWPYQQGVARFDSNPHRYQRDSLLVDVHVGITPERQGFGYALVPMIPAPVRQAARVRPYADRQHYILWEVEQWSERRLDVTPDRDPYLLRHLHGDAYAVIAEWELTELERLVMAGRRNA